MTEKYLGEERRARSGLERHVAIILQSLVLGAMVWLVNTVLELNKTAIRMEERYIASSAVGTRVETDVNAIRNQLQVMNTAIQASAFRVDNLEQRMKGIELMRDRVR